MEKPLGKITVRENDFFPEIRRKVNDHFETKGISRRANGLFYLKGLIYFGAMIFGYTFLLRIGDRSLADLVTGYFIFMGATGLLVVSVAHDASHHAVSKYRSVNSLLAQTWNLIGMSRRIWEAKHHQSHHIHTNLPDQDVDINDNPLIRLSPQYPWHPWYQYQHLYAPLLYFLFGPFQVFIKDFILFYDKKNRIRDRHLNEEGFAIKLILTKVSFLAFSLIVPLAVLTAPMLTIIGVYFAAVSITGFVIILILAVPHLNESGVWQGEVPKIGSQQDWALVQVKTTMDSSPKSAVLAWITGGLHTHLAHHLFPHICHVHYRDITPIIYSVLEKRGIAGRHAQVWKLLLSHYRFLKMTGRRPETIQHGVLRYNEIAA